jgi:Rrf2 family protein
MLKLTKKADYGLIALRHLAICPPEQTASAKEIAEAYGVPLPLLAKVMQKLTRTGVLHSLPGTNGGYRLARDPNQITALEVIRAIDGPIILTSCFTDHRDCDHAERCTVREPLRKIHESIILLLGAITIADIARDDMEVPDGAGTARKGLIQLIHA